MPPLAYLNGRLLPASQATISVEDAGFVLGVTVAEQLRTFGGRLFRLEQHLERMERSLQIVGVDLGLARAELIRIAEELIAHNHSLLADGDDLGLAIFVTPGIYATFAVGEASGPTVGMHTYPLPFSLWADKYEQGQSLVTTSVQQAPTECWPPELKCRSRMHYYLADREARSIDPQARAVLQSLDGAITETSTSNVLIYNAREGLVSPPESDILPGISLAATRDLAQQCGIPFSERRLMPDDLSAADEVLLTSTPNCLVPVTRFNLRPIGTGQPGDTFRRLLAAWSQIVGLDVAAQAGQFRSR